MSKVSVFAVLTSSSIKCRVKCWLLLCLIVLLASGITAIGILRAQAQDGFVSQAVGPAQTSQRETGVPASVTIAQAILESEWGRKHIGDANNYFGIKAVVRADGTVDYGEIAVGWVWAWTKEWDGSKYVDVKARFRKYRNMTDSFRDHGYFFIENPRYAEAMRHVDDPDEFARQIAKAGYATSPTYANDLIRFMSDLDLYQYDLERDDAQFVAQSAYPTVQAGQSFQIYFEVKNTGFGTWRQNEDYYLANVNNTPLGANPRQEVDSDVPPEATKRWAISMIASSTPDVYRTQWMLKHGDETFGPNMFIDVTVVTKPEDGWRRIIERIRQALERLLEDLRRKMEEIMEDWQRRMEQEMEKAIQRFLENLARELEQAIQETCAGPAVLLVGTCALIFTKSRQSGRKR